MINFNYKVIHIRGKEDRYNNIIRNQNKLEQKIEIFDAIIGEQVDLGNMSIFGSLLQDSAEYTFINEIGCYLSHFMLVKSIASSGYTIVFEDDFDIIHNNLHDKVKDIISKVDDFDLIYLGNINNNHAKQHKDNIYTVDVSSYLWGTYAYIINDKSAKRIYNKLRPMRLAIDNQYKMLIDKEELKAYVIYPPLVNQSKILKSTIR